MDKKLYQQDEFRELLTERYTCYRNGDRGAAVPDSGAGSVSCKKPKMQTINYGRKILALALQTCKLGLTEDLNGWMKFGLSKIDLKGEKVYDQNLCLFDDCRAAFCCLFAACTQNDDE